MPSFTSSQGDGTPAAAPTGTTISCQIPEKPPPVPWQQLTSMFETTSEANPASAPLIVANTTLEQDKATVLRCWLAMGGEDDELRRWYHNEDYNPYDEDEDEEEYLMRDEPSDNVSEWLGVFVEEGRVTELEWRNLGLTGTIPAEIGALSALTKLSLYNNKLNGAIPQTIGALSSLTILYLSNNSLSGVVPYSFSNLLNLEYLFLLDNNLSNDPGDLDGKREIQDYFISLWRHPTIRLLNYGIAITKKRQASLGRRVSPRRVIPSPHPFFAFLADYEDSLTDLIMSFLDSCYCCNNDRTALMKCWKSLGGAEDKLRQGYGDNIRMWKGVKAVDGGRVVEVNCRSMGLKGNLPSEIGELDGLRGLYLYRNEISSIPSEIGKLTSLTQLELSRNHLADLPCEFGNLRSLTRLYLSLNRLSVLPSTLANLTNLDTLNLWDNNFTIDVPSLTIYKDKKQVQTFLATLNQVHGPELTSA